MRFSSAFRDFKTSLFIEMQEFVFRSRRCFSELWNVKTIVFDEKQGFGLVAGFRSSFWDVQHIVGNEMQGCLWPQALSFALGGVKTIVVDEM